MAVTLEQVRALLEPEEPDYAAVTALGAEALPHLQTLLGSEAPGIAAKAASAAGFISDPAAVQVLDHAVQHEDPRVRVAAAGAARNLPPAEASSVLVPLVRDEDMGVKIMALKSVPAEATPELLRGLQELAGMSSLPRDVREMIPEMKGLPRPKRAPRGAVEQPKLSEMPGFDILPGPYSESISADSIPGQTQGSPGAASAQLDEMAGAEQMMPGDSAARQAALSAGREGEMPGFPAGGGEGVMASQDQEMPGFDVS